MDTSCQISRTKFKFSEVIKIETKRDHKGEELDLSTMMDLQ